MNFIKKHFYLIIPFLVFPACYSQNQAPFTIRYQSKVNGDMTIIANNITNRIENNNTNTAFYNKANIPKDNENFQIGYIDIDDDKTTFSSSSANLNLDHQENKKIIYAGLYWSATYCGNKTTINQNEKLTPENELREEVKKIKIKFPAQENYTDINGQVIFDGFNKKKYLENNPYVVYADITNEILKLKNPFGNYTVANIRATNGVTKEGSAAGWTIFFVYEDLQMNEKFIVSQDGFAELSKKSLKINFSGFETPQQGNINAKIALGALEGDKEILGDQLFFKTAQKNKYLPFENILRPQNNFFNSTITIGNDYLPNRNPNSNNTLGYDVFLASIPNSKNNIIANNSKEVKIKIKSPKDNCYLFFTAFNIETKNTNKLPKPNTIIDTTAVINNTINTETQNVNGTQLKTSEEVLTENTNQLNAQNDLSNQENQIQIITKKPNSENNQSNNVNKTTQINTNPTTTEYFNYDIEGLKKGYYIIVNVFAKEKNRTNFVKTLKDKGFQADSFYNPIKKYYYVFIEESNDKQKIQELFNSKINNSYQEDMWILAINNSTPESYTFNKKGQKNFNQKLTYNLIKKVKTTALIIGKNIVLSQNNQNYFCMIDDKQRKKLAI